MSETEVEFVRKFNRFYTKHIGVLSPEFSGTNCSLLEARILYEIGAHQPVNASFLATELGLDRGQVSRMISKFEHTNHWVTRGHDEDSRKKPIKLTEKGQATLEQLNAAQNGFVAGTLKSLSAASLADLVSSFSRAYLLLNGPEVQHAELGFTIRNHGTGDVPLLVSRQVKMYAETMGWGTQLEAVEMETAAQFIRNYKPDRDRCFIAEIDKAFAGGVLITDEGEGTARLRLFHVEPIARRRGIGSALVQKCIEFAKDCDQKRIMLWTHKPLEAARRIYARNGFKVYEEFVHHEFGVPVEGEMWNLQLSS